MLFIGFSVHLLSHWFYEDFIREENPKFPSLPLKRFSAMLFEACPVLYQWSHDHEQAFNKFLQYKTRVPVCGAIMLNDAMDKVFPYFLFLFCGFLHHLSYKVRTCQRMEIIIWLGLSKRENQRNRTPAYLRNTRGK